MTTGRKGKWREVRVRKCFDYATYVPTWFSDRWDWVLVIDKCN